MPKRKSSSDSSRKTASSPSIDLLKMANQVSPSRTLKVGSYSDSTRLQVGTQTSAKFLQFGSPSDKGTRTSSGSKNTSSWTSLLGSLSSGGISDLLGGGGLLNPGLDFLKHGFESLFGGSTESAIQPLTRFELPDAQNQTSYVNNVQTAASTLGIYNTSQSSHFSQTNKADIIRTVKTALLTSSSLNDVIGEL